jgi:pSer/pThr/pTyr-binding forkhead associated (FHA) protein
MKVYLTVLVSGPMQGKTIPISIPTFVIGRAPQCNLQPGNPTISATHCALKLIGDSVLLEDLGSATGTFVNDLRIEGEVQLNHGDRLQVGPLIFGVAIEAVKKPPLTAPKPAAAETKPKIVPETAEMPAFADSAETAEINLKTDETLSEKKAEEKPEEKPSTSVAAKELLKKYLRRKRHLDEPRF